MPAEHRTIPCPEIYGPGTFDDEHFLPVPDDARRIFEIIANATENFTKDSRIWDSVKFEDESRVCLARALLFWLHLTPPPHLQMGKRLLAGIRVVELVRIIAGPVIGTTLAALGADVIRIKYSRLPDMNVLQLTLNAGVRTVDLDLTKDEDVARLTELVNDADVFIQGF